jgi:hypothetical protein
VSPLQVGVGEYTSGTEISRVNTSKRVHVAMLCLRLMKPSKLKLPTCRVRNPDPKSSFWLTAQPLPRVPHIALHNVAAHSAKHRKLREQAARIGHTSRMSTRRWQHIKRTRLYLGTLFGSIGSIGFLQVGFKSNPRRGY